MELFPAIPAIIEQFSYFGIPLGLILGSIGFPLPEDAVLITCGLLLERGTLLPIPTLLVSLAGVLTSDLIIFSIGRRYGRQIVMHPWFGRIVSAERIANIERKFDVYGVWVILIGRQIFGVRSQIILMSGILKMDPLFFMVVDSVAAAVTIGIMITAGYSGAKAVENIHNIGNILFAALLWIIAAFLILFSVRFIARRLRPATYKHNN